ncbi:MAG: glutathione S-transferase family protein [Burkholderiales bacterium]
MSTPILVIGNKNYSSWSLRPWLAMKFLGIAFQELRIPLYGPGATEEIRRYSPTGKVPCLVDGTVRIWDSLAILEYLAESHPLWPQDSAARAMARSASAEMHSGFQELRQHMSMNLRRRLPGKGRTPGALADVARIIALWTECREKHGSGGEFLFGAFSAADAMYAPVVLRFRTYEVELPDACRRYAEAVLAIPAIGEWIAAAEAEIERIEKFEQYA